MNMITPAKVQSASTQAGEATSPKQARKRRMAREPKAVAELAAGANGITPAQNPDGASEPRGRTKIAAVIILLERPEGATLAEMVEATGWLPHTTRASLTGLKKKGHAIIKGKRRDVTCYSITSPAA